MRDFILMCGMEMGLIPVPRHKMVLSCDLVQGVVAVGVRPALPIHGVEMIWPVALCGLECCRLLSLLQS